MIVESSVLKGIWTPLGQKEIRVSWSVLITIKDTASGTSSECLGCSYLDPNHSVKFGRIKKKLSFFRQMTLKEFFVRQTKHYNHSCRLLMLFAYK